jgi:Flp pilus assembly protein TadB
MWEQVKAELEETIQENIYEQEFDLPSKVQGMNIQTAVSEVHTWLVFLLLGVGGAALLVVRQRSRLQEQMKQRKQLLLQEYPYFMNQILLYTSAGTTVLGAIERMLHQYENVRKTEQPLYQELLRLKNEIHTGVFQEQAYFNFGRRIGLLPYIKASSLFAQQIRKGGGGIEEQLEFEEHDAFEKRKELARKAGEEAGTKLLFPMILLMILSMVLVMYPALMSFTTGGF